MEISVLMSVYNEKLSEIEESINSILTQSLNNFEFIIVNDNPQRNDIGWLLSKYEEKDERILVINNNKNIGLAESLNKAAKASKGRLLARMDADDVSDINRFERQYEVINNREGDVVFTNYTFIDEDSKHVGDSKAIKNSYTTNDLNRILPFESPIHHPTVMMTRSIFEKVGGYRNFPCAQDRDLWLRIWEVGGKFYFIEDVLLKYRIRVNSISEAKKLEQRITIDYIQNLFINRLNYGYDNHTIEKYYEYLIKRDAYSEKKKLLIKEYTNILNRANQLKHEKKLVIGFYLRLKVFILSSDFRNTYLRRVKIRYALTRFIKGQNNDKDCSK